MVFMWILAIAVVIYIIKGIIIVQQAEAVIVERLGRFERELGPGEIVELTADSLTQLAEPGKEMHICAFLWSYYGYSTSDYEGINVEAMRYRNGAIMAENDKKMGLAQDIDYVGGVPDSGTPHAIGYANREGRAWSTGSREPQDMEEKYNPGPMTRRCPAGMGRL